MRNLFSLYNKIKYVYNRWQLKIYYKELKYTFYNRFVYSDNVSFKKSFDVNFDDSKSKIIIGNHVLFRNRARLLCHNNGIIRIGDNCFFNDGISINCMQEVTIGNNVIFGESSVQRYNNSI